jgi:acetylornithine deacetylase/succinyl-diaminopimelate desuccinylase-like protein
LRWATHTPAQPRLPAESQPHGVIHSDQKTGTMRCRTHILAFLGATLWLAGPAATVSPHAASAEGAESQTASQRAAQLLSRAISIRTVSSEATRPLAELYVKTLRKAGIEARVVPELSTASGGEGEEGPDDVADSPAAWGRLPGNGSGRPIILLSHLDVVPADAAAWDAPPFEGRITETHVLGRGALDAKGVSVIHLTALLALAESGQELDRDVIFLATADEETGGQHGAGVFVSAHRELLGEAEYLLTEGGGIRIGGDGTPAVWGIAVAEKSPCWIELTTRGTPGHASIPVPNAAVPRLIAALERVRRVETPLRVLPEVEEMFRTLATVAAPEDAAGYASLGETLENDRAFRSRFLSDPSRKALVRHTISITVREGAEATNTVPGRARARIDARLLRGHRCEDFTRQLRGMIDDDGVQVETMLAFSSGSSPRDSDLFTAIERVAAREDEGALVVPRVIAGFTDAHYFREVGIQAYGFTPRWLTAEDTLGIHGHNEQISIANLERGANTLVEILRELSRD